MFASGARRVVLRDLMMLKIKPAPRYAKVGGGQLKLAGNARTKVVRDGFGADFDATGLHLTSKFATRLNKNPRRTRRRPILTVPIAVASRLSPDGRSGVLYTEGAAESLQLGAGQVFWKSPLLEPAPATATAEVEVQPTPAFPGKLGPIAITSFDLSAATIVSEPKARTIAVTGALLKLSAQTAATFEEAFAKPQEKSGVFHAGELFGTVSFTAQGQ
jgi:hypothetical protein